jgi:cytosine/adenosine deaminase-related metal-dependent hydrolase
MPEFIITNVEHCLTGLKESDARFRGAIRVRNGILADMGDLIPEPEERVVDAAGCVVTPGFVNTHHHLFQSLMKSVPGTVNAGLDDWVIRAPYTYWPKLDEDAFRTSVEVGLAELVLSGTTTVSDLHYIFSESYEYDPAQVLVETAARFGVRFVLGRGGLTCGRPWHPSDLPPAPVETLETLLAGVESAATRWHDPSPMAMTRVAVTPVTTVFNLEPGEVREIAQVARRHGLRMHTHLSENWTYVQSTLDRFGKRPVHWMAEQDWVGDDVWFAHLVECDHDELSVLAEAGTAMAHCAQSNARLGSGIAPAPLFDSMGGIVSLGVDGTSANEAGDMGQTLYSTFTIHRAFAKDPTVTTPETVLRWATAGGAQALGFDTIGELRVGMAADIAIFSLDQPRYFGHHDPTVAPVISGGQLNVKHSFVGGDAIVENGRLPRVDIAALGQRATDTVARIRGRNLP